MGATDYTQLTECQSTGQKSNMSLGNQAITDFNNSITSGWFALGLKQDTDTVNSNKITTIASATHSTYDPPKLTVSYSLPLAPDPPTNLTTVSGQPIELDWDAVPTNQNGGSPITGYSVFRSDNQYAQTELNANSANANGLDFTNNEFYLRGLETTTTTGMVDVIWDSSTINNGAINGNTFTATSGSWSSIAQSTQTISPSTGGGEMTCTKSYNYAMCGLSKDPYWSSGNTFANGNYLMYHDEIYELGSGQQTFTSSSSSVYKVTMDSNGLVEYFVDNVSVGTSSVTASGDYYALATPDTGFVTAQITGEVQTTTLPDKSTNNISTTSLGSAIQVHRASNDWLSLGFKMADETTNSNNRYVDVSPSEESGTDPTLTIVADGTTYTLTACLLYTSDAADE